MILYDIIPLLYYMLCYIFILYILLRFCMSCVFVWSRLILFDLVWSRLPLGRLDCWVCYCCVTSSNCFWFGISLTRTWIPCHAYLFPRMGLIWFVFVFVLLFHCFPKWGSPNVFPQMYPCIVVFKTALVCVALSRTWIPCHAYLFPRMGLFVFSFLFSLFFIFDWLFHWFPKCIRV